MINPYFFTERNLKVGFKIILDSHHISHANSKITDKPNYPVFGIELRYINKIIKELSAPYARLKDQYKFEHQTISSASFDKQAEDNQVLVVTELFSNLNINHKLTESDVKNINVESPLEQRIQAQKMKDSGWRFDKINSMTIYFYKTGKMDGRSYVKIPLRSSAILNIENDEKHCFFWSILAKLHPCKNIHSN